MNIDGAGQAGQLADRISGDIGTPGAVAWLHAPALVQYAAAAGVMPDRLSDPGDPVSVIRRGVEGLARSHPLLAPLADQSVNPIWDGAPQAAEAAAVLDLWRSAGLRPLPGRPDGYLVGDLYQALSADARKNRALCQTPGFVTGLLLDLSWDRAAEEWGAGHVRMIDPACGAGHILVEAFLRALSAHRFSRLGAEGLAEQALAAVHGTDIDPYAVMIARSRLLVMAACLDGQRIPLADLSRDLPVQVEVADALLGDHPVLDQGQYHVVVANPPYITCKDARQREQVRRRYKNVCSGRYSLAVPFEPLMHSLCVPGGWVARLTANSFMKREFGKKLIEDYFPTIDLQWVIDTSGAYIPGHGTPTVILVSRNQAPSGDDVRAVLGKRGEPSRPADPAKGLVWTAIARAVREREALGRLTRDMTRAGIRPRPKAQRRPAG